MWAGRGGANLKCGCYFFEVTDYYLKNSTFLSSQDGHLTNKKPSMYKGLLKRPKALSLYSARFLLLMWTHTWSSIFFSPSQRLNWKRHQQQGTVLPWTRINGMRQEFPGAGLWRPEARQKGQVLLPGAEPVFPGVWRLPPAPSGRTPNTPSHSCSPETVFLRGPVTYLSLCSQDVRGWQAKTARLLLSVRRYK